MRKLGPPYGLYVPVKYVGTEHYEKFIAKLVEATGGATITPISGYWKDANGVVQKEDSVKVETRASEFDYSATIVAGNTIHDFSRYLLTAGEKEVFRFNKVGSFMQHIADKAHAGDR